MTGADLASIEREVVGCRACPRLVEWRERVAREKTARFADETYWARPVPGFGDPDAAVLVVGLAPAAHGGNRTGRIFTGDRSGDFLFASMHRTGFANQPTSEARGRRARVCAAPYVTAVNRCAPPANKPTTDERDRCLPFLGARDRGARAAARDRDARGLRVGRRRCARSPRSATSCGPSLGSATAPRSPVGAYTLLGCFHPSQQNTFTGTLTAAMIDEVFGRAAPLARE